MVGSKHSFVLESHYSSLTFKKGQVWKNIIYLHSAIDEARCI